MDLKRWLIALALAALFTGPMASTTTLAADRETAVAGPAYHDHTGEGGDGEEEGEEGEGEEGEGEEGEGEEEGGGGEDSLSHLLVGLLSGVSGLLEGLGDIVGGDEHAVP